MRIKIEAVSMDPANCSPVWGVRECPVFGVLGTFFSRVDWGWRVEAQVSLGGLVGWLARQLVVVSSVWGGLGPLFALLVAGRGRSSVYF